MAATLGCDFCALEQRTSFKWSLGSVLAAGPPELWLRFTTKLPS